MNNSASHHSDRFQSRLTEQSLLQNGATADNHRLFRGGAVQKLLTIPVQTTSLLTAQRLALQSTPVLCICHDYRAAQRHYVEAIKAFTNGEQQAYLLHEMMPLFQQEYILDCLRSMLDFALDFNVVVFTSAKFFHHLQQIAPAVVEHYKPVEISSTSFARHSNAAPNDPTISCICLRTGGNGRWVLMDHEPAAVASPSMLPTADVTRRLLRHTVQISGARLAPYLAMMFDVPSAWKHNPDLAACALLVFHEDQCATGCVQPGIPKCIIWNDLLGVLCGE